MQVHMSLRFFFSALESYTNEFQRLSKLLMVSFKKKEKYEIIAKGNVLELGRARGVCSLSKNAETGISNQLTELYVS